MKQRITIVGTGLVGASLGLAIKKAKLDVEVVGHDKLHEVAGQAKKLGAFDRTEWNLPSAVQGAGMVIIATPLSGVRATLQTIAPMLQPGVIVTDTASVKQQVLAWAEELLPVGVDFVGGHPLNLAGGAGVEAASADLFQGSSYCLIPGRRATERALETVISLVGIVGARPFFLDAAEHDAFAAAVAQLPYLLSAALITTVTQSPSWREMRRVAAANFEAASRLAAADPTAYADAFAANKEAALRWIDEFSAILADLRQQIAAGGESLPARLQAAQEARAEWLHTRDQDLTEMDMPKMEGAGQQIRQMFMGNLGRQRELPGQDKK